MSLTSAMVERIAALVAYFTAGAAIGAVVAEAIRPAPRKNTVLETEFDMHIAIAKRRAA